MPKTIMNFKGNDKEVIYHFNYQPPEPKINIQECIVVTDVFDTNGKNITPSLTIKELDDLEEIALEDYHNTEDAFIESLHDYNYSHQKEAA